MCVKGSAIILKPTLNQMGFVAAKKDHQLLGFMGGVSHGALDTFALRNLTDFLRFIKKHDRLLVLIAA